MPAHLKLPRLFPVQKTVACRDRGSSRRRWACGARSSQARRGRRRYSASCRCVRLDSTTGRQGPTLGALAPRLRQPLRARIISHRAVRRPLRPLGCPGTWLRTAHHLAACRQLRRTPHALSASDVLRVLVCATNRLRLTLRDQAAAGWAPSVCRSSCWARCCIGARAMSVCRTEQKNQAGTRIIPTILRRGAQARSGDFTGADGACVVEPGRLVRSGLRAWRWRLGPSPGSNVQAQRSAGQP
jgi:hypothetical protein